MSDYTPSILPPIPTMSTPEEEMHEVSATYHAVPDVMTSGSLKYAPALECSCGFVAQADTWEDAGIGFDEHVAEINREEQVVT